MNATGIAITKLAKMFWFRTTNITASVIAKITRPATVPFPAKSASARMS